MSLLGATFPTLLRSEVRKREEIGVTVCIAAICEGNIVLGASDRMITWGDVQFEPEAQKVFGLTSSIATLTAGDATVMSEVGQAVQARINAHVQSSPTTWLTVREVAECFVAERNALKLRHAEAAVLQPLGMTAAAFQQGLHGFSADLAKTIATDLVQYQLPYTAWIVCGLDEAGAHIYTVIDGYMACQDQVGFAAIGMGARHAESQFMSAEHSKGKSLAETLLLIYTAKKRAEVAPGVGAATDLILAGPALGTLMNILDSVRGRIDEEYRRLRDGEREALARAKLEMETYVDELRQPDASAQVADGNTLADDDGEDEDIDFVEDDETDPD